MSCCRGGVQLYATVPDASVPSQLQVGPYLGDNGVTTALSSASAKMSSEAANYWVVATDSLPKDPNFAGDTADAGIPYLVMTKVYSYLQFKCSVPVDPAACKAFFPSRSGDNCHDASLDPTLVQICNRDLGACCRLRVGDHHDRGTDNQQR